jgi:ribonuclease R
VKQRLVGERSGTSFQLGDKVTVQVARVSLDDKKIDLELVEGSSRAKRRSEKSGKPLKKSDKKPAAKKKPVKKGAKKTAAKPGPKTASKKSDRPGSGKGVRKRTRK